MIDAPGIYPDLDELRYHADDDLAPHLGRSLSASGAKVLLRSPARFAWERDHPTPTTDALEIGSAVHSFILGSGPTVSEVKADSWRTKAAQEERDAHRRAGMIPLLTADFERALRVATAVSRHPLAGQIITEGQAESSMYWIDSDTGITCRGRIDFLRANAIVDVKTTIDATPEAFRKSIANFGYDVQAAHYQDGIEALTGDRLPFVFVVVEKTPPYLVGVYQLDDDWLAHGADQIRQARRIYADCEAADDWPGLPLEIVTLTPPRWL